MKLLNNLLQHDKLKHLAIGTLVFICLDLILTQLTALSILLVSLVFWEVGQRFTGGTNTIKEMLLDFAFGIFIPILLVIIY